MTTHTGNSWAIKLADGWKGQAEADAEVLYDPEGAGALRISAARKDDPVTDEDLQGFAAQHPEEGASVDEVRCGEFSGFRYTLEGEHVFLQQWFLRAGTLALFITYNCAREEADHERAAVDAMLDSLSVVDS